MKESINKLKIHKGTYEQIQENIENIGEHDLVFVTDKSVPIPNASDVGKTVMVNAQGEFILAHKTTQVSYVYDTFDMFKASLRYTAESPYELTSIITSSNEEVKIKNVPLGTEIYIAEENVPDYWLYTKKIDAEEDVQGGLGFFRTMETKPKANAIIEVETLPENPLGTVFYKTKKGLFYIIDGKWHIVQDKLTFDETPTEGSINPVTSGGLHKILKDGVGGIIDVESLPYTGWKGTPLPHNDTTIVENLYFNTSLSVDEVVNILAANFPADGNISYITIQGSKDPAGDPTDGFNSYLVGFVQELNTWAIANLVTLEILNGNVVEGAKLLFVSNPIPDLGINFKGWNPDIVYPISYNLPVYHSDWNDNPPVKGELISDLVSTTPFVYSEEEINDKCIYRLKEITAPLPVPADGTAILDEEGDPIGVEGGTVVEKLYFNTNLSQQEVIEEFNKLNLTEGVPYVIFYNPTIPIGYALVLEDGAYAILDMINNGKQIFAYDGTDGGWATDFTSPVNVNGASITEAMGITVGAENDKITNLVSITPFGGSTKYTYWVYKGKWVRLLSNEDEQKDDYIVIEKTSFNSPDITFTDEEFNTIKDNKKVILKLTTEITEGTINEVEQFLYKTSYLEANGQELLGFINVYSLFGYHLTFYTLKREGNVISFSNYSLLESKQDKLIFDDVPSENSTNPVKSGGIYAELQFKQNILTFDETPTENSTNPVTSDGVYNALAAKLTTSLSDVSSTTNVATTDKMLINKAGTMYKVTIQELQEVFGSANYKGNFVSVDALPATGTAGDYAFVKVVTDGDTDLIMYIWNDTDKHWEETGTSQYVKNATFQATMATKQDKLNVSLDENDAMNIVIPESIEGAKTIKVNGVELVPVMEDITWENLKTLRDEGKLIPGKSYKIIDYTCTTSQADTISAHHDFDIIVTADSPNTLSETARASLKEGDTYYRTVDESSSIINTTNCKFIDESIIDDNTIRINVVGYQYTDKADENYNSHPADIFLYATYDTNPHGYTSPVIYKTSPDYLEEGVDMEDPFFYVGTWELEGQVYDRWKKHEDPYSLGYTWSLTDRGDQYLITENIVQGDVIDSDPLVFEVCNLSAWELKYCLDNDVTRFAWADTTNGKGVIYYMKDEHGNEAWYDFKSIKQKVESTSRTIPATSFWKNTPRDGDYVGDEYFYTFHYEGGTDISVKALITKDYSPFELWHPKNNKINSSYERLSTDGNKQTEVLALPYVCFYMNDYFISAWSGFFLWTNTCITGRYIICVGTMWDMELVVTKSAGLCGIFNNSRIVTRDNEYYEGVIHNGCDINVYYSNIQYYKVLDRSTINGKVIHLRDELDITYIYNTYIYTEDFKDPELLIQESYEEEEE